MYNFSVLWASVCNEYFYFSYIGQHQMLPFSLTFADHTIIKWSSSQSHDQVPSHMIKFPVTWSSSQSHGQVPSHMIKFPITWSSSQSHDQVLSHMIKFSVTWSSSQSHDQVPSPLLLFHTASKRKPGEGLGTRLHIFCTETRKITDDFNIMYFGPSNLIACSLWAFLTSGFWFLFCRMDSRVAPWIARWNFTAFLVRFLLTSSTVPFLCFLL